MSSVYTKLISTDCSITRVDRHVSGEVVVGVEDLPTLGTRVGLLLAGVEARQAGETVICPGSSQLAGLWEGKCWEPEVLCGGQG